MNEGCLVAEVDAAPGHDNTRIKFHNSVMRYTTLLSLTINWCRPSLGLDVQFTCLSNQLSTGLVK